MEYKTLTLDFKVDEDGHIEGYGSVFGNLDNGGDIVVKGAFENSIEDGRKVKMLYQHDPSSPIGVWDEVKEDEYGLRCKGRLALKTTMGRETHHLIKMGAVDGLSIGYRPVDVDRDDKGRLIKAAELWEVSVVTFPMNEAAVIDAKAIQDMTPREIEAILTTRDASFSASVAKRLMAGGIDALRVKRDADEGIVELADAMRLSLMRANR